MNGAIKKMGNSQGIRLNKTILEQLELNVNDEVSIEVVDKKIIIEKKQKQTKQRDRKNITELFAGYVADEIIDKVDFDDIEPVGKEIW
ncbi:AbrB/MazE/SpoVT family DNA-binding domain-containing protein [Erysipelotrichaceae bacterium OttesenSCG-928-M19]|nr:AbrB/MazE/SpoVT family DNA-binding domain-containing protein [Erysipelotrichaceae bacterium OttesenSCG-928-M19]